MGVPHPGDRFGDFELLEEVGRGAMGSVWRARQLSLDRVVALKVLAPSFAADPLWVARFRAEAGQASRLSHAGILPVYAVGERDGLPWFAMELVRGEDLARRLASGGPLPAREAAEIARDAARALHHAHEHGIVHRDVKPANLMRREDGRITVTDFGLAKTLGSGGLTTTGLLVGTPYYMSPEAIRGGTDAIGPASDVYGLGATLYELLTGSPPFPGENAVALLRRIAEEEPTPPSRLRPDLPRDLETVVLTCLAKDPARRYASARALAEDLHRFLAGEPIESRRPGPVERLLRAVRRHRTAVAAAALGVAAVTVTAVFFLGRMEGKEEEHRREIDRLLGEVERNLARGDVAAAETALGDAQALGAAPDDEARLQRSRERVALERLFSGLQDASETFQRLRRWQRGEPAHLALDVDPPDARIEARGLLGPGASLVPGPQAVRPGMYRLRLSAPGRVTTTATVLLAPLSDAAVRIALPPADAETVGLAFFAGFWVPEVARAGAEPAPGAPLVQAVHPYLLDERPVSNRAYAEFLRGRPAEERSRWTPPTWGAAGPGAAAVDQPVMGLTYEQAEAYAASRRMRVPTEVELKTAALGALPEIPAGAPDPPEGGGRVAPGEGPLGRWRATAQALERLEGIRGLGFPPAWAVSLDGAPAAWPSRGPGVVGPRRAGDPSAREVAERTTIRLARSLP